MKILDSLFYRLMQEYDMKKSLRWSRAISLAEIAIIELSSAI